MDYTELIKELRICGKGLCGPDCSRFNADPDADRCQDGICLKAADAIEELQIVLDSYRKRMWAGSDWISVKEKLPEDFQKVLVFWREHSEPMTDTAFWQTAENRFTCGHWDRIEDKITHWRPLPEPPEEET